jgi:hypothetical protein
MEVMADVPPGRKRAFALALGAKKAATARGSRRPIC